VLNVLTVEQYGLSQTECVATLEKTAATNIIAEKCGVWFVQTFDGRILIDEFLTEVIGK
jgi:hypothetical protein